MKKTNKAFILMGVILLSILTVVDGQTLFTGSEIALDDAAKQTDDILIGVVEHIGPADVKGFGEKSYYGVKVRVIQIFKGHFSVSSEILVALHTRMKKSESPPVAGTSYLLFIKKNDSGGLDVIKLLPAGDASSDEFKKMLTAADSK